MQQKAIEVKLRAGGSLHGSQKPEWNSSDMEKYSGKVQKTMINKEK